MEMFSEVEKQKVRQALNTFSFPEKLSEALRMAIEDFKAIIKNKKHGYYIDLDFWHIPREDGCAVCLAGSVLAKTLKMPININITPTYFKDLSEKMKHFLRSINHFRNTNFHLSLRIWNCYKKASKEYSLDLTPEQEIICKHLIENYSWNPDLIFEEYHLNELEKAVDYLERKGL